MSPAARSMTSSRSLLRAVARTTACALVVASVSGCLVTSSPSFEEPERTPPFLLDGSAQPDLRRIKVVDSGGTPGPVEFGALVRSEDNGATVLGRLVLDYGIAGPEYPYQKIFKDRELPPGTLDDPPRSLTAKWFPGSDKATLGCHNVTLFATHDINPDTGCPENPADFDFLMWTVIVCDSTLAPCCDPTEPPGDGGCADLQCPDVSPDVRCDIAPSPAGSETQAGSPTENGGAP